MSHSIGAKLSGLRHKGYITDDEYLRLKKALEQESIEDMPCVSREEMQKCKDIVKKYTPKQEPCNDVVSREAIEQLKKYTDTKKNTDKVEISVLVLNRIIKALSQEPCDDAVSREELLKAIDTWDKFGYTETGCFVREPKGDYVPYIHYDDVIKCIKGMPSVTQKAKTGHWITKEAYSEDKAMGFTEQIVCSNCDMQNSYFSEYDDNNPISKRFIRSKYCPNCGAKMVEPQKRSK